MKGLGAGWMEKGANSCKCVAIAVRGSMIDCIVCVSWFESNVGRYIAKLHFKFLLSALTFFLLLLFFFLQLFSQVTFTITMHHRFCLVFAKHGGNVFFVQCIIRQHHYFIERSSGNNDEEEYGG